MSVGPEEVGARVGAAKGRPAVPFWRSLGRAQVSAFAASALDMAILFGATELLGVWYVVSAALGAFGGAVANFLLNRSWSFAADHADWRPQALRYALVSAGSLALNVLGVYAFTDGLGLKYGYSKLVVSLAVALFFNFPLHRRYVFK